MSIWKYNGLGILVVIKPLRILFFIVVWNILCGFGILLNGGMGPVKTPAGYLGFALAGAFAAFSGLLKDKVFVVLADGTIKLITDKGIGTVYPTKNEINDIMDAFYTDCRRFPYSRDELVAYATTKSNMTFSSERYAELEFSNDLTNGIFEVRYTLTNNLGSGQHIFQQEF